MCQIRITIWIKILSIVLGVQTLPSNLVMILPFRSDKNILKPNLMPGRLKDPPEVCYEIVGCFSNKPPWSSIQRLVYPPRHPSQIVTHMFFHNRQTKNNTGTKFPIFPDMDLSKVDFDVNKQTFVLFHGNHYGPEDPRQMDLVQALLKRVDANVFLTDFAHGKSNYFQTKSDIRVAGRLAAIVLLKTGIPPSKMHFLGISLGCHMAAYTANYLAEKREKPGRITGFDPARPDFQWHHHSVHLDKSDAEFVDMIHTAAGQRGYLVPFGHVDYYVNGGYRQPGCTEQWLKERMGWSLCSHVFSILVFTKSLEEDGCIVGEKASPGVILKALSFGGIPVNKTLECGKKECISMGLGVDRTARGVFYVPTNKPTPFICNNRF